MQINKPNIMRLRNIYLQSLTKGVKDARDKVWNEMCYSIIDALEERYETRPLAFRVDGNLYPESAVERNRKSILYRNTVELEDEDLLEKFDRIHEIYKSNWEECFRIFKNMLAAVFREAKSYDEITSVIPDSIMNLMKDEVDFLPLSTAKGISPERAEELKEIYKKAFNVNSYLTASTIL